MLVKDILERHDMYNEQLRYVEEQEKQGNVYVIRPAKPLDCSSMDKDTAKLEAIYQLGYRQGQKEIEKVKAFLADENSNEFEE